MVGYDLDHSQRISADDNHHILTQAPTICVLYAIVDKINSELSAERALCRTQVYHLQAYRFRGQVQLRLIRFDWVRLGSNGFRWAQLNAIRYQYLQLGETACDWRHSGAIWSDWVPRFHEKA